VSLTALFFGMMKTIIMIDGGFFKPLFKDSSSIPLTSAHVSDFTKKIMKHICPDVFLLRVYWYDSPPFEEKIKLPISKKWFDFSNTPICKANKVLLNNLKRENFFSVREGRLSFDGWRPKKSHIVSGIALTKDLDFKPEFTQKGVDIKIGIDIAWISHEKIADRIICVTGDSDFIPALKLARRHGIQVYLFTLGHGVKEELKDHSDVLDLTDLKTIYSTW
jgi:uncharacterized LabA/DUF88 family protein